MSRVPESLVEDIRDGKAMLVWGWNRPGTSFDAPSQQMLESLPQVRTFLTTDQGDALVRALRRAGRQPVVIAEDDDVQAFDENRTVVIQPYGAGRRTLLDAYGEFVEQKPRLDDLLRYLLLTRTILFVHWDPNDDALKTVYQVIFDSMPDPRPVYAIAAAKEALGDQRAYWESKNWTIWPRDDEEVKEPFEAFAESAAEALSLTVSTERKEDAGIVAVLRQPTVPYKYLDSFAEIDRRSFHGRYAESNRLAQSAVANRLVLLYGPSGIGKSSLIQAGVSPLLRRWEWLPLCVTLGSDPWMAYVPTEGVALRLDSSDETKQVIRRLAQEHRQPIVIFLDQFEQAFGTTTEERRDRIAQTLADLVQDPTLALHLVISIREDFLAELASLQKWLPGLFANRLKLQGLTREGAREAMVKPARDCGLDFEADLPDLILDDVAEGGAINPAHLQIVCSHLWRELQPTEQIFTVAGYPGARRILADYLDDEVRSFGDRRDEAKTVLKALVSAQRTRIQLSKAEVANRTGLGEHLAGNILEGLIRRRLVRTLTGQEPALYELSHEKLLFKITEEWIDGEEQQAKAIQDMLRAEQLRWREGMREPLGSDKLGRVQANLDGRYLWLDRQSLEMLLRSALSRNTAVDPWLDRMPPSAAVAVLRQVIQEESVAAVRARSVRALATAGKTVRRAMQDDLCLYPRDEGVGLKRLNQEIVNVLLAASRDGDPSVRLACLSAFWSLDETSTKSLVRIGGMCADPSVQVREMAEEVFDSLNPEWHRAYREGKQLVTPLGVGLVAALLVVVAWGLTLGGSPPALVGFQALSIALLLGWLGFLVVGVPLVRARGPALSNLILLVLLFVAACMVVPAARESITPFFTTILAGLGTVKEAASELLHTLRAEFMAFHQEARLLVVGLAILFAIVNLDWVLSLIKSVLKALVVAFCVTILFGAVYVAIARPEYRTVDPTAVDAVERWLSTVRGDAAQIIASLAQSLTAESLMLPVLVVAGGLAMLLLLELAEIPSPRIFLAACSLGFVPAIFAATMQGYWGLFLPSAAILVALLVVVTLLRPRWGNLWARQPTAWRVLLGSIGCALAVALLAAPEAAPGKAILRILAMSALAIALTTACLNRPLKDYKDYGARGVSAWIFLNLVVVGSVAWIGIGMMTGAERVPAEGAKGALANGLQTLTTYGPINLLLLAVVLVALRWNTRSIRHWMKATDWSPVLRRMNLALATGALLCVVALLAMENHQIDEAVAQAIQQSNDVLHSGAWFMVLSTITSAFQLLANSLGKREVMVAALGLAIGLALAEWRISRPGGMIDGVKAIFSADKNATAPARRAGRALRSKLRNQASCTQSLESNSDQAELEKTHKGDALRSVAQPALSLGPTASPHFVPLGALPKLLPPPALEPPRALLAAPTPTPAIASTSEDMIDRAGKVLEVIAHFEQGAIEYDECFDIIEPANGSYLGECGMTASETMDHDPRRVTAFEVWLFDKSDIRTLTTVLAIDYAYDDEPLRKKLAIHGDVLRLSPDLRFEMKSPCRGLIGDVVALEYDDSQTITYRSIRRLSVRLQVV